MQKASDQRPKVLVDPYPFKTLVDEDVLDRVKSAFHIQQKHVHLLLACEVRVERVEHVVDMCRTLPSGHEAFGVFV